MTDRYKGCVVTLDQEYRSDDAEEIIAAIKMVKGVLNVTPSVADFNDHMNRDRVRAELSQKLWDVLKPPK